MRRAHAFVALAMTGLCLAAEAPYDFRQTDAYRNLSNEDRQKLETVDRDFTLLWGALDRYADDHADKIPDSLAALKPFYLKDLPMDPFAPGKDYGYRAGTEGNRAWVIRSAGLPDFPYLAAKGNISLYRCKGTWISGMNPTVIKAAR